MNTETIKDQLKKRHRRELASSDRRTGCGVMINAGICGLDFYANGRRVICRKCKARTSGKGDA